MSRRTERSPSTRGIKHLQKRRARTAASLLGGWRPEVEKKTSISATTAPRLDSFGREEEDDAVNLLVRLDSEGTLSSDGEVRRRLGLGSASGRA